MKTCKGCRFIYVHDVPDGDHVIPVRFCCGAPPTPIVSVTQEGQNIRTSTAPYFPTVPDVRCGAYQSRWEWLWFISAPIIAVPLAAVIVLWALGKF